MTSAHQNNLKIPKHIHLKCKKKKKKLNFGKPPFGTQCQTGANVYLRLDQNALRSNLEIAASLCGRIINQSPFYIICNVSVCAGDENGNDGL